MAGTAPDTPDAPRTPSDQPGRTPPRVASGHSAGWWLGWCVATVLAAVVVVLLWQPWQTVDPTPGPTRDVTSLLPTAPGTTVPTPTPSPVPPPGADAVFDPTTASSLFSTEADVERGIPGATVGATRGLEPGTRDWGLPEGTAVEPASCTAAVTVVSSPPVHHDATSWVTDELTFEQDVVVLLDTAAARAAFRALVTTLDECPRYAQVAPEGDGPRWTAEPALEGQGVFPAVVHDLTVRVDGDTYQQTAGHVLVGNAILTWTATALAAGDRDEARAVLGAPVDLSQMVETRALAAVRGLPDPGAGASPAP